MEFVRQKAPYGNCEDVSRETNRKHNVYVEKLHEIGYSRAVSSQLAQWFSSWALFSLTYVNDISHRPIPAKCLSSKVISLQRQSGSERLVEIIANNVGYLEIAFFRIK